MTDIQRYSEEYDEGQDWHYMVPSEDGLYVLHADHVADKAEALRQAEQRVAATSNLLRLESYEQGQRDMLTTLSDTKPGVIYRTGQRDALAALRTGGACVCQCGKASHAIKGDSDE